MPYKVFVRNWWKLNPEWPNGLAPCLGKKKFLETVSSAEEARERCRSYNETHQPGKFSRKAEFEEV